jgi:large subunit ribosomal protein L6
MTNLLKKNYSIKIPVDVNLIYIHKKKMLVLISPLYKKSVKLSTQIFVSQLKKTIKVSRLSFLPIAKSNKIHFIPVQKTNITLIKQSIFEISVVLYQKLRLVGVGYRVFNCSISNYRLLLFKLGYSHFIYFKIAKNVNILNFKMTTLFFFCNFLKKLTEIVSFIRLLKKPEPYKGKGILHKSEQIKLKKSKKI